MQIERGAPTFGSDVVGQDGAQIVRHSLGNIFWLELHMFLLQGLLLRCYLGWRHVLKYSVCFASVLSSFCRPSERKIVDTVCMYLALCIGES